jgi:hypothetical protein
MAVVTTVAVAVVTKANTKAKRMKILQIIELLEKRGYDPRRDKVSIGRAVTALLSDLVLEAA